MEVSITRVVTGLGPFDVPLLQREFPRYFRDVRREFDFSTFVQVIERLGQMYETAQTDPAAERPFRRVLLAINMNLIEDAQALAVISEQANELLTTLFNFVSGQKPFAKLKNLDVYEREMWAASKVSRG